jgi:GAF domain-containing protein
VQVLLETGTPDFYVNKGDRAAVVGQIQEQGFVINYELLLKQADGTPFWGLLSAQLLTFDGVPAILTTILDITDRKEAEKVQQELSQNLSERLEEMNALQRAVTREGWSDFLASGKHTVQGFMFGNDELHPVAAGKLNESLPAAPIDFESVTEISVSPEKAAMNVPLNLYGESIGVIGARTQSGEPLSEEQQVLLKELSEQVTEALERARLFEETEVARTQTEKALAETAEQARRRAVLNLTSEQLNRAGTLDDIFNIIAENTAQILPSDRVSLAILDDDKENFTVMSLAGAGENVPVQVEQSLAGSFIEKAIETSDILVTHDAEPSAIGIRSSMIVPLITGTGTIGTLNVGSKETHAYDDGDQSLALQIASLLSSVIVNKRLLTETEERAKELALINRVVAEVSSSLDIKYSLQVVADELAKAIDVDAVGIALMNPDMASLTVTAEYYDSKTAGSSLGYKIPIEGNLLTQKVLNERQTVLVEDAQNNPLTEPVHQGMRQRGLNTLYLIPMFAGNKIVGTVGIDIMEKGRLLSPSQLRLAETLVFQAATAVQNAQLYAQAEERAEELTLINAVSDLASSHLELSGLFETVGQLLCGTFAAESLYFALYNKQAETIAFPYFFSHEDGVMDVAPRSFEQGGYTGQIIASRESLLRIVETEAPAEEMKAEGAQVIGSGRETDCYLGTPMIVGNEVIGVLGLSSYREIRTYNKQDQRLLETLADTIGVAVQNIRQFQAAQRQAEREAMINAISQKIQAAPTVERALQTAVAELGQALKLKKAIVKLSTTKEQNGSA